MAWSIEGYQVCSETGSSPHGTITSIWIQRRKRCTCMSAIVECYSNGPRPGRLRSEPPPNTARPTRDSAR